MQKDNSSPVIKNTDLLAAYVKPEVLCTDELGYLPIDKFGADCLLQIISHRLDLALSDHPNEAPRKRRHPQAGGTLSD